MANQCSHDSQPQTGDVYPMVIIMLAHGRRRWLNIKSTMGERV